MVKHLPKNFGLKPGAEKFPLMVVIAASYVCNSKCPGCPYTNSDIRYTYRDVPFMPPKLFRKIARECGKFNAFLRISGGGEPLLHPKIIQLIEYAKKMGAKVGLITNGSLMEKEKANRLLACGIDMIEFSVDAGDKETYIRVRKGLDFNTLLRNVKYTVERRNQTKSPTRIIVSIVNQKALKGKLKKAVKFWKGIVDKVQVRKYLTWGINNPEGSADKSPYIRDKKTPCPFPFERLNIDTRGDVQFCGYDIKGETNFGNLNKQSIQSIWQGDKFNTWRKLHLKGEKSQIKICRACNDWQYRSWTYNYWKIKKEAGKKRAEVISKE